MDTANILGGYQGVAENYRQGIYGHRFVLTVTPFCSIRGFLVDCFLVSFCLLTPLDDGLTMLRAFLSLGGCNGDMRAPLGLFVGVPFVSNQHIHFAIFTHLAGTFGLLLHVFEFGGNTPSLRLTLLFPFFFSLSLPY